MRGNTHTNKTENFWRLLKDTYVQVDPERLTQYMNEQTLRFNNHETDEAGRFAKTRGALRFIGSPRRPYGRDGIDSSAIHRHPL